MRESKHSLFFARLELQRSEMRPFTMATPTIRETDLYPPIKRLLEGQGYEVKGEIGAVDVVACRGDEPPVIVELKTGFSLTLIHQAIERQSMTDAVYIAVPHKTGRPFYKSVKHNSALCRRLGLGLMTVRVRDGHVAVHVDPAPYKPRKSSVKRARLLREFSKRVGDPNIGGATRGNLVTAYRQDALRCLQMLHEQGQTKASEVSKQTGVEHARRIMADDHYGWFARVERGIYAITPKGEAAIVDYKTELDRIAA
jgi:hypothetical protein